MPPQPTLLNIWCLVVAFNVGRFLRANPLIFGRSSGLDPPTSDEFFVYQDYSTLDKVLSRYKGQIGDDYERYRNHCLRVLSYALYFLKQDPSAVVSQEDIDAVATSLAYHDIALWTDGKLSYLEPSVGVFERDLQSDRKFFLLRNDEDSVESRSVKEVEALLSPSLLDSVVHIETVREIIRNHHRYNDWKNGDSLAKASLVNAVRKADWADATLGMMRSGLPIAYMESALVKHPSYGFHLMLANMGSRLSPDSYLGRLDVFKILKW
jgi:hypothetical protein